MGISLLDVDADRLEIKPYLSCVYRAHKMPKLEAVYPWRLQTGDRPRSVPTSISIPSRSPERRGALHQSMYMSVLLQAAGSCEVLISGTVTGP